ncbi:hypothetical protein ACFQV4_30625 [Streptomyces thermocarboxydus]
MSEPVPYRGRKGIITYWPVATREQTVVCGSLRQWRLAVELDFEPAWAAFSAYCGAAVAGGRSPSPLAPGFPGAHGRGCT